MADETGCIVRLPLLRGRYTYTLVWWLTKIFDHVAIVWAPSSNDLAKLHTEGRLMFRLPGVTWLRRMPAYNGGWTIIYSNELDPLLHEKCDSIEIREDIGECPPAGSFILPYTVHSVNFDRPLHKDTFDQRPVSVFFFAGVTSFYQDRELIPNLYKVPGRDESVEWLRSSKLPVRFVTKF